MGLSRWIEAPVESQQRRGSVVVARDGSTERHNGGARGENVGFGAASGRRSQLVCRWSQWSQAGPSMKYLGLSASTCVFKRTTDASCGSETTDLLFLRQTFNRDRRARKCLRNDGWRALQDSNLRPPGS